MSHKIKVKRNMILFQHCKINKFNSGLHDWINDAMGDLT